MFVVRRNPFVLISGSLRVHRVFDDVGVRQDVAVAEEPLGQLQKPYPKWPVVRRSVVAAFQRSLTPKDTHQQMR